MSKGLSFYDKQHIQKVLAQQNDVANIFNSFILSITPYLRQWDDRGGDSVWVRNQSVENRIDNELMNLASQLMANISLFQIDAWKRSDTKNDDFIRKYIEGMSISTAAKEGMFTHNLAALAQLQNDFDARGNKLSTSVWNLADQTKTQLEYYLKTGLSTGQNAARISQDVRQILNEPDKRFRRIKNDKGELVLSQPMKDYHPSEKYGPGVYRSAKMNALRLTSTTTNMAYRSADYDRWSKQDFVLGIQIQRSANNRGPCKLCDSMVGEYPKTFKFTGFHPFCICIATPIVMKPEELADFLLDDTIPQDKVIKDIPKNAQKFINENRESIKNSYWYMDNYNKDGKPMHVIPTPDQGNKILDSTKAPVKAPVKPKTTEQKAEIQQRWIYRKVVNTEDKIRLNKKFETGVVFDSKGVVVIDKRGKATSVQFTEEECAKMKDCIFTHNHPRGWGYPEKSFGRIGNSFSPADIMLAVGYDVSEMRAVTPNYTFVMKRPSEGWGVSTKLLERIIDKENESLKEEFYSRIYAGKLTPERASAIHYHILWKRIAKKTGWSYSKSKTR